MKDGDEQVEKFLASGMKSINGWKVGAFFGDGDFFSANWLMRAGAAKGGLYGNDAEEAMYPYIRTDATGNRLMPANIITPSPFPPDNFRR